MNRPRLNQYRWFKEHPVRISGEQAAVPLPGVIARKLSYDEELAFHEEVAIGRLPLDVDTQVLNHLRESDDPWAGLVYDALLNILERQGGGEGLEPFAGELQPPDGSPGGGLDAPHFAVMS